MISTVQATLQTFQISQKEFPGIHGKHNKANAFRHALWNVLIAKKCARFSSSTNSILRWTEFITDWHEEFAPNEILPKTMDLHNNRIGREIYQQLPDSKLSEIIAFTKDQLENAVKIEQLTEIKNYSQQLVYLEN